MIRRMNLTFAIASDEDQHVMKAYGVQNPKTKELALHAVYIVDTSRRIFYRKVASRRPLSQELLDAVDYYQGTYPVVELKPERGDIPVAFPRNRFQALLEIASNSALPGTINPEELAPVVALLQSGRLDEATIRYQKFAAVAAMAHDENELLATAAWFTKTVVRMPDRAIETGRELEKALVRQSRIRQATDLDAEQLNQVQHELDGIRTRIRDNADAWRLRAATSTLRGYRELSLAALRK